MEMMYFMSAVVSSVVFWVSLSVVVLLVSMSRHKDESIDFSYQFVDPGTLAQKAPCAIGVDDACKKAGSIGEELACRHKKLVTCYASKRIPDGTDEAYVSANGDSGRCIGMVAHGSDGPFTNRTTFPVCLGKGEYVYFPRGHPYRYVARDKLRSYALRFDRAGYVIPERKDTSGGQPNYVLPDGKDLPYGLTETLVRLRNDYGYDVFPIYEYDKDGILFQADLSKSGMTITRR